MGRFLWCTVVFWILLAGFFTVSAIMFEIVQWAGQFGFLPALVIFCIPVSVLIAFLELINREA